MIEKVPKNSNFVRIVTLINLLMFEFLFKALHSLWSVKNFCSLNGYFNYVSSSHSICYLLIIVILLKNKKIKSQNFFKTDDRLTKTCEVLFSIILWMQIEADAFWQWSNVRNSMKVPFQTVPPMMQFKLIVHVRPSWKMLCKQNGKRMVVLYQFSY